MSHSCQSPRATRGDRCVGIEAFELVVGLPYLPALKEERPPRRAPSAAAIGPRREALPKSSRETCTRLRSPALRFLGLSRVDRGGRMFFPASRWRPARLC